jgi:predicted RND superfamily exporter protein
MLFIPLIAVIYTAIVAVAGFSNIAPSLLKMTQGFIWYIAIGLAVASGLIALIGASMGREKKPKAPKPPKVKKEKPPKPVKEKKAK